MKKNIRIDALSVKTRIALCFAFAVIFAFSGFATLFIPTTARTAVLGVTIMCFVAFYGCFSKGYDLRAQQRAENEGKLQ